LYIRLGDLHKLLEITAD